MPKVFILALHLLTLGLTPDVAVPVTAAASTDGAVYIRPDRRYLPDKHGGWESVGPKAPDNPSRVPSITAAERGQIMMTLSSLKGLFQATPVGATLAGIRMVEYREHTYPYGSLLPAGVAPSTQPLAFAANLYPHAYVEDHVGGNCVFSKGDTEGVSFRIQPTSRQFAGRRRGDRINHRRRTRATAVLPASEGNREIPRSAGLPGFGVSDHAPRPRPLAGSPVWRRAARIGRRRRTPDARDGQGMNQLQGRRSEPKRGCTASIGGMGRVLVRCQGTARSARPDGDH
jgi:hypothetical protein